MPASGFFEWKQEGKWKHPFYLSVRDQPLFAFAGLYDVGHDPAGTPVAQYTIITTEPNALAAMVHNRMPAILSPESEEIWLSGKQPDAAQLKVTALDFNGYPAAKLGNAANWKLQPDCAYYLIER